jgi:hypothetical protein
MIRAGLLAILFFTSTTFANSLSPKLYLRTGYEMLSNEGKNKGNSSSTGGFNLLFNYYLTQKLSAGFGYSAWFDPSLGVMPIHGYSLNGRYYYYGKGTHELIQADWGTSEYHSPLSSYAGMSYNKYTYFLGKDPQSVDDTQQLSGDYSTVNVSVGADYRLNRNFELNAELGTSVFTFAASDDRVRIGHTGFLAGITYVF